MSANKSDRSSPRYISGLFVKMQGFATNVFVSFQRKGERHMDIKRAGSQPSGKGPADWFTGTVRIDPLFAALDPARAAGNAVTFEPGARTAWHTHPLGQTLI